MFRHPARVNPRVDTSAKPPVGTIAEGMVLGIIACVILLAGWEALPGPDPSRRARMLLLALTMLAGAAIAAVTAVKPDRPVRTLPPHSARGERTGQDRRV